jgi:hypothetical protein
LHWGLLALLVLIPAQAAAQELEPRALTNVPIGWNFAMVGYRYATGNVLLDPAVPIEDLEHEGWRVRLQWDVSF